MTAPKPLASLSSGLLARKGAARPAMRPQLAFGMDEDERAVLGDDAPLHDDLGWNDHGEDASAPPVVVQQIEALSEAMGAPFEKSEPENTAIKPIPALTLPRRVKAGKEVRSALQEGRKAAFTLRLDSYRHMRLRLACTLEDRSAQAVVTEALDRFLADLPGLEDMARRAATRN